MKWITKCRKKEKEKNIKEFYYKYFLDNYYKIKPISWLILIHDQKKIIDAFRKKCNFEIIYHENKQEFYLNSVEDFDDYEIIWTIKEIIIDGYKIHYFLYQSKRKIEND